MTATTGTTALAAVALRYLLQVAVDQLSPEAWRSPADLLLGLCALAGSVVLARLAASLLGCLVAWVCLLVAAGGGGDGQRSPARLAATVSRAAIRTSPRLLRPVLVAALGGSLVLGPVTIASAGTRPDPTPTPTPTSTVSLPPAQWQGLPDPGWLPPRPAPAPRRQPDVSLVAAAPTRDAGPAGIRDARSTIAVRRGDTLWSIAARHLGPAATDVEIARAWPAWWQANRDLIGDDPNLIRPGQLLQVPAVAAHGATS
jgi:hypothetical protein